MTLREVAIGTACGLACGLAAVGVGMCAATPVEARPERSGAVKLADLDPQQQCSVYRVQDFATTIYVARCHGNAHVSVSVIPGDKR
jgi:hypothetical protein